MNGKPRCYVASPLGFSDAGSHYYAKVLLPELTRVVEIVDPWALVDDEEILAAEAVGREREFAAEIGRRNLEAIESCEILVAVLDGQEVDSGTAAEIGFGAARGLRCLGLRTDRRKSGEPGAIINLQVEAFISMSGGRIARSLEELIADLRSAARSLGSRAGIAGPTVSARS